MHPRDLRISRKAGRLTVIWEDGSRSVFTFEELRKACPCALCEEERRQKRPKLWLHQAFQLQDANLVGNYAIQFLWADGHNDGIYNWEYLYSLKTPEPPEEQAS